jgi:hypothetical protein
MQINKKVLEDYYGEEVTGFEYIDEVTASYAHLGAEPFITVFFKNKSAIMLPYRVYKRHHITLIILNKLT